MWRYICRNVVKKQNIFFAVLFVRAKPARIARQQSTIAKQIW